MNSAMALSPCVTYIMEQMFFFLFSEQILHNIKQEYKRLQKRRHLDSAFQQADGCCPLELPNIHSGSALPGSYQWHQSLRILTSFNKSTNLLFGVIIG